MPRRRALQAVENRHARAAAFRRRHRRRLRLRRQSPRLVGDRRRTTAVIELRLVGALLLFPLISEPNDGVWLCSNFT